MYESWQDDLGITGTGPVKEGAVFMDKNAKDVKLNVELAKSAEVSEKVAAFHTFVQLLEKQLGGRSLSHLELLSVAVFVDNASFIDRERIKELLNNLSQDSLGLFLDCLLIIFKKLNPDQDSAYVTIFKAKKRLIGEPNFVIPHATKEMTPAWLKL